MIPILFSGDEVSFTTNGIGRLTDCISCTVTEERNGIYECEFEYPMTGQHYQDIQEGCIIAVIHSDQKDIQPFDIYARSAPISGVVTFYAHHISYRLGNVILKPFTASSCAQTMAQIVQNSINENPFTFWTDKSTVGQMKVSTPKNVKDFLGGSEGSVLDIYGKGDYEWDKFTVKLYQNRGIDSGVEIRYGKNLLDITQEIDISETYSAVVPYWVNSETGDVVTVEDWIVATEQASYTKVTTMDLSDQWDEAPTEAQLRQRALQLLEDSQAWLPDENIEVDFIALWQTAEYENIAPLQRVKLCDKVSVFYPDLGVSAVKMQVISVTYDVLMERYTSLELGKAKISFAQVVKASTTEAVLKEVPTKSMMQQAIEAATQLLAGGLGGHMVISTNADGEPNELLFMDTDDKNTAVHVMRINMNGIGFSSTGYEGPFHSAWTLDGSFVADWITAGTLNANLLKAGIIQSENGSEYWNLETGEVRIGGNAIVTVPGDALDEAIHEAAGVTTRSILDNANAYGLGWKVNHDTFTRENNGECFYHGYAEDGTPASVAGWVVWKGEKVTIGALCRINPNATMPFDTVLYSVYRTSDSSWHDVCFEEATGKWIGNTYSGTQPSAAADWTWNEDTDIILASYMIPAKEGAIYGAQLFTPPKKASELPEGVKAYSASLVTVMGNALQDEIDSIEAQLDGVVDTYYLDHEPKPNEDYPSTSNEPADAWNTAAKKAEHVGDLYLDTNTGKSYRWVEKPQGNYLWVEIPDTASAEALQMAREAKAAADGKIRLYTFVPTTEQATAAFFLDKDYDPGDLWFQGVDGDIMVCFTKKAAGSAYSATHWRKWDKYTDELAVLDIVQDQLSTIEIGGRNLLWDTNAPTLSPVDGNGIRYISNIGTIDVNGQGTGWVELPDSPIAGVRYGMKHVCTASGDSHGLALYTVGSGIAESNKAARVEFKKGQTYTASFWAKSDTAGTEIYFDITTKGNTDITTGKRIKTIDEANEWKRFTMTFTWTGDDATNQIFYFGTRYTMPHTAYCCGYQLETGDIATDWSEHPRTLISYGGRNLIRNTNEIDITDSSTLPNINGYYNDGSHYGNAEFPSGTVEAAEHGLKITCTGAVAPYIRFGTNTTGATISRANGNFGLEKGQWYTFSYDYRCKLFSGSGMTEGTNYFLGTTVYGGTEDTTTWSLKWTVYHEIYSPSDRGTEKSGRAVFRFKVPEDVDRLFIRIAPNYITNGFFAAGDYIEARNIKLEKGNTATEWQAAGEDYDNAIYEVDKSKANRNYMCGTGNTASFYEKTDSYVTRSLYATYELQRFEDYDMASGDKLTMSFDWEQTDVQDDTYGKFRINLVGRASGGEWQTLGNRGYITPSASETSGHFESTWTITTGYNIRATYIRIDEMKGRIKISNFKIERGELATPWISAHEDAFITSGGDNMLRS